MVSRRILSWGLPALLTAALLLPAPAAGQEVSTVTVQRDGDAIVLIPKDPGKSYLVLAYPRVQEQKGSQEQLSWLKGEQRLAAKEFSKIVVVELRPVTEVALDFGQTGLRLTENPCQPGTCDLLFPLGCPPRCPHMFLQSPGQRLSPRQPAIATKVRPLE